MVDLGVNISLDPTQAAADCSVAAGLGAKWVRTSQEQNWGTVSSRLGPFRKAASDHGLLLINTCQPTGHVEAKTSVQLTAWGEYVAEVAAIADLTGTGNEPQQFGGTFTPEGYGLMVLAAITARDKLASGRRLMTPEMEPGSGVDEPVAWFCKMVDSAPGILTAAKMWIGWHGYCDTRYPATTAALWNTCYAQRMLHTQLAKRKAGGKKIVNGEFGAATGPSSWVQKVTPDMQATRLEQYMQEIHNQELLGIKHGPMVWYQLRDRTPSGDWTTFCGLVDVHGAVKPAGAHFQALAAAPAGALTVARQTPQP